MLYDKIQLVVRKNDGIEYVERYRSGHNEAVLKTVCPKGRVGSNPTLSATVSRSRVGPGPVQQTEYRIP